jgi:hypothetical protein
MMEVIKRVVPYVQWLQSVEHLAPDRTSRRHLVEALVSFVIFSRIFEGFDENRASSSSVDLWMPSEMTNRVRFIDSALKESSE